VQRAIAYDARGNVTGNGSATNVFDAGNRLTSVTGKESYLYDGYGRRVQIQRLTDGKLSFPIYSMSGQLISEDDQRSNTFTDYISFNGSLVAKRKAPWGTSTWTTFYEHTDALHSPVTETDANGTPTSVVRYTPYGEATSGIYVQGPGFTGHVTDAVTGLTYAQKRYYDPVIGRFLSVDAVTTSPGNGSNFNRYSYANNNPYNVTDPDGRLGICLSLHSGCENQIASGSPSEFTQSVGPFECPDCRTPTKLTYRPIEGQINRRSPPTADGGFDPTGSKKLRNNGARPHKGIDIGAAVGTDVHAAGSGTATNRTDPNGYGTYIVLDHGDGLTTRYAHLSESDVDNGELVDAGTVIGKTGTTGNLPPGANPHLHFEVRLNGVPQDPTRYFEYDYAPNQ
jgi:RHS repeat-associated protein